MNTIKTRISTNSDPTIDTLRLEDGHPMVPDLGILDVSYSPYGTMFNKNTQFLTFRGQFKASHAGFYGIYGPAWAARAEVDAQTSGADDSAIEIKVTDDVLKAGIQWGASHTFQILFKGEEYQFIRWRWKSKWWGGYYWPEFGWRETSNKNGAIPLDFIKIIKTVIDLLEFKKERGEKLEAKKNRQTLSELPFAMEMPDPPAGSGIKKSDMVNPNWWGLLDEAGNTFNKDGVSWAWSELEYKNFHNGEYMEMKAYPGLVNAFDIWKLMVKSDERSLAFGGFVMGFDTALAALWSELSFGVTLGVLFPFHLSLENILFNDKVYGDLTFDSTQKSVAGRALTGVDLSTYNKAPATSDLDLFFKFSTGIDIRFGLFANVTLLKVLSFGFSVDWNIFEDWFDFHPHLKEEGVYVGGGSDYAQFAYDPENNVEVVFG